MRVTCPNPQGYRPPFPRRFPSPRVRPTPGPHSQPVECSEVHVRFAADQRSKLAAVRCACRPVVLPLSYRSGAGQAQVEGATVVKRAPGAVTSSLASSR